MKYLIAILSILLFKSCTIPETEVFYNCHDPEHEDFIAPNIIFENFEAVYDTSDISISWLESGYCGLTEYRINLNNRNFENADYSTDWFSENMLELKNLDDGIWDLTIFIHYEIMDHNDDIDLDTFNYEFEINQIRANNLRLSPMYLNINEEEQNSEILIDLIVEELSVEDLSHDNILNGISGFGIELLVPTSLEFINASQINENFTNLDYSDNTEGIESYWQILPYDDLHYKLIFSFLNNLDEQYIFIDEI